MWFRKGVYVGTSRTYYDRQETLRVAFVPTERSQKVRQYQRYTAFRYLPVQVRLILPAS
jgi:hypothetical protein